MDRKVDVLYGINEVAGNYATVNLSKTGKWYVYNCFDYPMAGTEGCFAVLDRDGYCSEQEALNAFKSSVLFLSQSS